MKVKLSNDKLMSFISTISYLSFLIQINFYSYVPQLASMPKQDRSFFLDVIGDQNAGTGLARQTVHEW